MVVSGVLGFCICIELWLLYVSHRLPYVNLQLEQFAVGEFGVDGLSVG